MNPLKPPPLQPPVLYYRYRLFISHAWDYCDDYERLQALLNARPDFHWENLSVPHDNPLQSSVQLPKSYRYLVRQLDARIRQVDCVLVLAGMYVKHRGWIQSEIEAAQAFSKRIIAVEPRSQERFPAEVMNAAHASVGWNTNSIISAIRDNKSSPYDLGPPGPLK
jgi:hypothetical protein